MDSAHRAQRVLQIRIDLDFFREFGRFDFDEGGRNSLHVRMIVIKRHSTGSNRILVFVGIDSYTPAKSMAQHPKGIRKMRIHGPQTVDWKSINPLTGINYAIEQIVHDFGQTIGRQFAMQSADEHRFGWIEFLRRGNDIIRIGYDPWNHFDLKRNCPLPRPQDGPEATELFALTKRTEYERCNTKESPLTSLALMRFDEIL